ncbi:Os03g0404000 [Oryza sativa Japonica Group]|uniref:Os03g0404000 protein n=1 Tax=Oryza sativa subsp. japonica TaxID=39947 RepID=A0A0P0VYG2_ORYSJ|nr:Os03g0404000 [Oryza sativa Japonica Group]
MEKVVEKKVELRKMGKTRLEHVMAGRRMGGRTARSDREYRNHRWWAERFWLQGGAGWPRRAISLPSPPPTPYPRILVV